MNFRQTDTQAGIQHIARDFAERRLAPQAARLDREGRFPHDLLHEMAELGLMGVNVPSVWGGAQAGALAYALALMEISRACASTAVTMAVTNMVAEVINLFGTQEQKQRYIPNITSGAYAAASFALSEPEAGSDPGSMRTTATKVPHGWELTGQKQWITSGAYAGVLVVWARTGGPGAKGLSCFLVERGTPGLTIGKPESKMGLRASNTVPLGFESCRVSDRALLAEREGGFKIAMAALDGGRIGIASQACGIASAALEASLRYAQERTPWGKQVASLQSLQGILANSRMELDAAKALTLRAAWLKEQGRAFSKEAAMAKLYASEMANRVCSHAVQIHGGHGYTREFAVERHFRDARVTTIYEGTSEIQRMVIARHALRGN